METILDDMEDEIFHEEAKTVADNMQSHGGSFVQELGEAIVHADPENTWKIATTWPELWKKYANWGQE